MRLCAVVCVFVLLYAALQAKYCPCLNQIIPFYIILILIVLLCNQKVIIIMYTEVSKILPKDNFAVKCNYFCAPLHILLIYLHSASHIISEFLPFFDLAAALLGL